MSTFVPPGGAASMAQQTPAAKAAMGMLRSGGTKRRTKSRRTKRAKSTGTKRRKKRSGGKPARLVKGSAAAKRYMASIRKKRK